MIEISGPTLSRDANVKRYPTLTLVLRGRYIEQMLFVLRTMKTPEYCADKVLNQACSSVLERYETTLKTACSFQYECDFPPITLTLQDYEFIPMDKHIFKASTWIHKYGRGDITYDDGDGAASPSDGLMWKFKAAVSDHILQNGGHDWIRSIHALNMTHPDGNAYKHMFDSLPIVQATESWFKRMFRRWYV